MNNKIVYGILIAIVALSFVVGTTETIFQNRITAPGFELGAITVIGYVVLLLLREKIWPEVRK